MMRRPLIAANWKMHKTIGEAVDYARRVVPLIKGVADVDKLIAPSFTALSAVSSALAGSGILVAAQDVFYEEKGAFTGEISPSMVKDAGGSFVIVGHSERRQFFGETDTIVNKKAKAALKAGLGVILCMGETLEERNTNRTFDVIKRQVVEGLSEFSADEFKNTVLAY